MTVTSKEYLDYLNRRTRETGGWGIPTLDEWRHLLELYMAEQEGETNDETVVAQDPAALGDMVRRAQAEEGGGLTDVTPDVVRDHLVLREQIEDHLTAMAKEIWVIKGGKPIDKGWHFDKFVLLDDSTKVRVDFVAYQSGDVDYTYVEFPMAYLEPGCNWRKVEADKVAELKRQAAEQAALEKAERARQHEVSERAAYQRLKKKYG